MFQLILIAAVLAILALGLYARAGSSDPSKSPWPFGTYQLRLGGFIQNGKGDNTTPAVCYKWIAPYDCYVRSVREYLTHGAAGIDLVTLRTIDATKKTIVAQVADPGTTNVDAALQTLHSDIVNFKIVAGNGIEIAADTSQSNEAGHLIYDIEIEPAYQRVAQG